MAQAPFNYVIGQPDADSYFESVRAGRQDRLAVENDQKMNALARYLPGALQGDENARNMALQSAPVDQMAALKQTFAQMDAPKLQAVKDFRTQTAAGAYGIKDPAQWAAFQEQQRAEAQRLGLPFKEVPFEQKDSVIAMGRTVEQLINEEIERKKLALDESRTTAQNAASYASADASRANADFIREGKGQFAKPVPKWLQDKETDLFEKVQIAGNNNADVSAFVAKIDSGEFDPGLLKNKYDQAKSFLGAVDPNDVNARNYNSFITTMERLRNESLRLNKGVQTDGDAKRAWNELFNNINDKTIVRDQLARIAMLNQRAAQQHAALARNQRKNYYGDRYQEPDWESLGIDPTLVEIRKPTTSFTRGGAGVFSDSQSGQQSTPAAPQGWSIKRVR